MQNQHQLLTRKTSKWHSLSFKKTIISNYHQKLDEISIFSTFALKNYGKFTDHSLEKMCPGPWPVASTIPILGLERICSRKVDPWPQIFFDFLALASNVVSPTPTLIIRACEKGFKGYIVPGPLKNPKVYAPSSSCSSTQVAILWCAGQSLAKKACFGRHPSSGKKRARSPVKIFFIFGLHLISGPGLWQKGPYIRARTS